MAPPPPPARRLARPVDVDASFTPSLSSAPETGCEAPPPPPPPTLERLERLERWPPLRWPLERRRPLVVPWLMDLPGE